MLTVRGLRVRYGPVRALRDISFDVPDATVVAFVVFGYAQQVILAQTIEAACKKVGDQVQTDGLLPALNLSKVGGIPRQTRILRPNAAVEGGLEQVQDLAADDFAVEYRK